METDINKIMSHVRAALDASAALDALDALDVSTKQNKKGES